MCGTSISVMVTSRYEISLCRYLLFDSAVVHLHVDFTLSFSQCYSMDSVEIPLTKLASQKPGRSGFRAYPLNPKP